MTESAKFRGRNYSKFFLGTYISVCGSVSSVDIATELRAGQYSDQISVGGEISRTCPEWSWGTTSLLCNEFGITPGDKERPGRYADPSQLLVPWSKKSRATTLLCL